MEKFGLADPEKYPIGELIGDPGVSGSRISDYPGVPWKKFTLWFKENYKFACLVGLITLVVIVLIATK